MTPTNLRETLLAGTANPPPPRHIDLAQAMVHGGRRRRRRRAVASVLAGTGVCALVLGGFAAARVLESSGLLGEQAIPPAATPRATAAFDPLTMGVSVGWLPEPLRADAPAVISISGTALASQAFFASSESETASQDDGKPGDDRLEVDVAVFAPGQESERGVTSEEMRQSLSSAGQKAVPGPVVRDRQSLWVADTDTVGGSLWWQWAQNQWAKVELGNAASTAAEGSVQDVARRIAESVTTDGRKPVRFPFGVEAPAAPLRLVETQLQTDGDVFAATAHFGAPDSVTSSAPDPTGEVYVGVSPVGTSYDCSAAGHLTETTTPEGHKALVGYSAEDGCVVLPELDGYQVTVIVREASTTRLLPRKAALDLADTVRLVDDPQDVASWVTPVR